MYPSSRFSALGMRIANSSLTHSQYSVFWSSVFLSIHIICVNRSKVVRAVFFLHFLKYDSFSHLISKHLIHSKLATSQTLASCHSVHLVLLAMFRNCIDCIKCTVAKYNATTKKKINETQSLFYNWQSQVRAAHTYMYNVCM